jgi:hypothetical protein
MARSKVRLRVAISSLAVFVFALAIGSGPPARADEPKPKKSKGGIEALDSIGEDIDKAATRAAEDTGTELDQAGVTLEPGKKLLITANTQKVTRDCTGIDVDISGNMNTVVLRGECKTVSVRGNSNTVEVNAAARIITPGNQNKVVWVHKIKGAAPKISNPGNKNTVSMKKP